MKIENVYEIATALLGKIEPIGESNPDEIRLENLKETIKLINSLINDIIIVARHKGSYEHSMAEIGKEADKFITYLKERLNQ